MPGTVLSDLNILIILTDLILTTTQWDRFYCTHFTDEETVAQSS